MSAFDVRPYLVAGGAMGLPPAAVRAASVSDLDAMLEGWLRANGVDLSARMSRADLDALIAEVDG